MEKKERIRVTEPDSVAHEGTYMSDARAKTANARKMVAAINNSERMSKAASLQRKINERVAGGAPVVQQYPYINSDPPARKDAQIYGIYKMNAGTLGKLLYVGQTTLDRAGTRFQEHVREDAGAPWYGLDYSSDDDGDWPYVPRELEKLKNVTKFEVTAAEQYWIDKSGGKGNLLNKENALTLDTFKKYKDIKDNYTGTSVGFPDGWKPKQ